MHSNLHIFKGENRKKIAVIGLMLPVLGSAVSCGASSAEMPTEISEIVGSTEQVRMNYTAPTQVPNILIDQVGYETESEKAVVFRGKDLPETFTVRDLQSGDVVYTGEILRVVYNDALSEYDSLGYFTGLKNEGSYYIYADVVGESYSFDIKENIYNEVFDNACKKYYINRCGIALSENYAGDNAHSACHNTMARLQEDPATQIDVSGGWHLDELAKRDTNLGSRIAENLLMAYEMNPSAFTDESGIPESGNGVPDILDEVKYEMDWLLKMQDSRTGGEYGAAVTDVEKGGDVFTAPVYVTPVDLGATISFASTAARFSYFYQQYDSEFATACLKAADRAWSCFLNNQEASRDTSAFKAAAQLYRATGADSYHQVLNGYFGRNDFNELFATDENVFLGSITYLSISQSVDVEVCTYLMRLLMRRAENIAQESSASTYLVTDVSTDSFEKMLDDMRCLTITDHIIYNHEYTTIIENHAHFLMGMNPKAVNYVTNDTQGNYENAGVSGVVNDPGNTAMLIFMLSVLKK